MSRRNVLDEIPESPRATRLRLPEKTGMWRSMMPVLDSAKCVRCGICWMYCPDRAVEGTGEGGFEVNYDYCKGCGICAEECPNGAITMVEDE